MENLKILWSGITGRTANKVKEYIKKQTPYYRHFGTK